MAARTNVTIETISFVQKPVTNTADEWDKVHFQQHLVNWCGGIARVIENHGNFQHCLSARLACFLACARVMQPRPLSKVRLRPYLMTFQS